MTSGLIDIPCTLMRGGTSKGPFFLASDLPTDSETRAKVLLAALGSPDVRQIDGVGGADPLTSKVGIVSSSQRGDVDLDFLFAQVSVDKALVDTTPNCGNMLAAVVPFAIERGLISPSADRTTVRVLTLNTGTMADITVQTPGGQLTYVGDTRIDGVPGGHAPISIAFRDTSGSVCGALLPTGKSMDIIDGVPCTLIDNGMPVVVLPAHSLGISGYESRDALNADKALAAKLEPIRLKAGRMMGLGDVAEKPIPKMTLISPARAGGAINTRTFIPHVCHASIGVLGAVTVATACALEGSIAHEMAGRPTAGLLSIEHPSGEFTVDLDIGMTTDGPQVRKAALIRTARRLFAGAVAIPRSAWPEAGQGNRFQDGKIRMGDAA
ncbi:4-oxalomesaconate tautomerase [Rhodoligotrophos defluvii]|uniref:4-oxalomesaconate tautomerase n=1 Tax=Rhodoligotrophos defluvii TaxID=2561934 RepID=UPI0010C94FF6|nr:4-oxalomesaconate tautomerase [Rhodoligotrophos defluvii]